MVVSRVTLTRYQLIFRWLLSLRHLEGLLLNVWTEHGSAKVWKQKSGNVAVERWKRKVWTLRARMIVFGSSNGGEAGAGERLERLLELGNCEDVVLIVFRWYGGVKLGSDRWRCISAVAKEALERGGFLAGSSRDDSRSKGSNDTRKRRK